MALGKTDLYSCESSSASGEVADRGMVEGTKDFALRSVGKVRGSAKCPEVKVEQIIEILGTNVITSNDDAIKIAQALTLELQKSSEIPGDTSESAAAVVEITRFRVGNVTYFPYDSK